MSSSPEQSNPVAVVEKRKPVTAAQCVFNIALNSAYICAIVFFASHNSRLPAAGLFSFLALFAAFLISLQTIRQIHILHRIRCGEQADHVFVPVKKRESFARIYYERFNMTGAAVMITILSISLFHRLHGLPSLVGGCSLLLLNIAIWRGAYHSWMRDRNYREPKVKLASEEAAEQSKVSENVEKVPVAVGGNAERIAAAHWWTDTPLREENKQRVGR